MAEEPAWRRSLEFGRRNREQLVVVWALHDEGWRFSGPSEAETEWVAFVARVEAGYPDEHDDYAYLLASRCYLEEIRRRLPGYWSDWWAERLRPWDERFKSATFEETTPHLHPVTDDEWWLFRTLNVLRFSTLIDLRST